MMNKYEIGAYYFPNWHVDPGVEKHRGPGWTEWELLKAAIPHFEGHQQPKVPLWGYEDESNPVVMAKKIDAAAKNGLTSFIFDWYWYEGKPLLGKCLEKGFMGADNSDQLKFAIMWCNHNWVDVFPHKRCNPYPLLYPSIQTEEEFVKMTDYIIKNYFSHSSYWVIDGGKYFSIYDLPMFVEGMGGVDNTKRILKEFRERVRNEGLGELHINAVRTDGQILRENGGIELSIDMLKDMGFDSFTTYAWALFVQPTFPTGKYIDQLDKIKNITKRLTAHTPIPYYPNVSMGWDSCPRCVQTDVLELVGYPYGAVMETSPEDFKAGLQWAKDYLDNSDLQTKMFVINAWNEWTEGSYLEPDMISGMGYLEAIKDVFVDKDEFVNI